jgi:hypothetical protein
MSDVTAEQIVTILYKEGYFERGGFNPSEFESITHKGVGLGMRRALDVLVDRELTQFQYNNDPDMNPRDMVDSWRVVLTEEGKKFIENLE